MKKITLAILVITILAFGFASCDNGTTSSSNDEKDLELSIVGDWITENGNWEYEFDDTYLVVTSHLFGWVSTPSKYTLSNREEYTIANSDGMFVQTGFLTYENLIYVGMTDSGSANYKLIRRSDGTVELGVIHVSGAILGTATFYRK